MRPEVQASALGTIFSASACPGSRLPSVGKELLELGRNPTPPLPGYG